jgi:hypothetical protein
MSQRLTMLVWSEADLAEYQSMKMGAQQERDVARINGGYVWIRGVERSQ